MIAFSGDGGDMRRPSMSAHISQSIVGGAQCSGGKLISHLYELGRYMFRHGENGVYSLLG